MDTFKNCIGASNESVMNVRVNNAEKNALAQSKIMIEKLKMDYANIQNEIENKLDLGMEQTTDLGSSLKNLNAESLLKDIYAKADSLAVLARQIKIRVSIHNVLFPDNKMTALTKDELDFLVNCFLDYRHFLTWNLNPHISPRNHDTI